MGSVNLPALAPAHASQMFGKNVATFLRKLVEEGELVVDLTNDVVGPTCLTH
jgi:NAD(P) transhydrogenase subunit alpha